MSKLTHEIIYWDKAKTKIYYESWYNIKGELHRIGNPASIWYYENGNVKYEYYYLNGKSSRIDGPADIYYYKNGNVKYEYYYLNDKASRIDGPACIYYYKNGKVKYEHYYLNHKQYSKEEYCQLPEVKEFLKQKAFDEVMLEILSE